MFSKETEIKKQRKNVFKANESKLDQILGLERYARLNWENWTLDFMIKNYEKKNK